MSEIFSAGEDRLGNAHVTQMDQSGHILEPLCWSITQVAAAAAQATISKAAVAGVIHVCNAIIVSLETGSGAGGQQVNLRDGASGAGTILVSFNLSVPAVADTIATLALSGLNIPGTPGNAMTLEFGGGAGAGTVESVALVGYDI